MGSLRKAERQAGVCQIEGPGVCFFGMVSLCVFMLRMAPIGIACEDENASNCSGFVLATCSRFARI